MVKGAYNHRLGIQNVADSLTYQFVDGLHIHLTYKAVLNAVNNGKLCISLFGLCKETGGFVEKPRIFQSHTHTVGQSAEQANIGIAEGKFDVDILQAGVSANLISNDKRYKQSRFRKVCARDCLGLKSQNLFCFFREMIINQEKLF